MTTRENWDKKETEDLFLHPGITEQWTKHPDQQAKEDMDWECVDKKKRPKTSISDVLIYLVVISLFALAIVGAVLKNL